MNSEGKRSVKVANQQKRVMVEFIKNNPKMIEGSYDNWFTQEQCKKKWENLASILNSMEGSRKTWLQWRKGWYNLRNHTRKKYHTKVRNEKKGLNDILIGNTGHLSKYDRMVLDIIGLNKEESPANRIRTRSSAPTLSALVVKEDPDDEDYDTDPDTDPIATEDCQDVTNDAFPSDSDEELQEASAASASESGRQLLNAEPSPIVKMAQEMMESFRKQAKADEEFRQEQLRLMREQTEAIKSIASSLEQMRK